ncbi:MAG: hypothetical protein R2939_10530 [Kofleriaceae bacterium]
MIGLVVLAGAALFLVTSAYVVGRGGGAIAAGSIGGLVFPVLPLTWHAVGEHRRRRRAPARAVLLGSDRLVLRMVAIAALVLTPLVALDGARTWRSLKGNAGWWLGRGDGELWPDGTVSAARLLSRVPAEATTVVVGVVDDLERAFKGERTDALIVVAWHEDRVALFVSAAGVGREIDDEPDAVTAFNDALRQLHPDLVPMTLVERHRGNATLASPSWHDAVGPSGPGPRAEIRAALALAPAGAQLKTAVIPSSSPVRFAASWEVARKGGYEFAVHFELAEPAHLDAATEALRERLAGPGGGMADATVTSAGTSILARARALEREAALEALRSTCRSRVMSLAAELVATMPSP